MTEVFLKIFVRNRIQIGTVLKNNNNIYDSNVYDIEKNHIIVN